MKRFLPVLLCVAMGSAQNIDKQKWHWDHSTQDADAGYAQVVKIDNILYLSGVPAIGLTEKDVERVYKGIEMSLAKYGATFQNVVKENLYTTDIEAMKKVNETRKKFYKNDYPAATWVQVDRLYMPEAKLEVEVIAHLPK
ncbi:RidA family protein [Flavobacterium caeni]|uniref:Endoribonuclease L-PSP n=1 Tax=Flavobacterium caeni TaxID=490189 RepID=A0A1G5JBU9_9FLAO|nr:RidA family protein [Flavobacterium caeni]SCY85279.1 Endoribonuclease L-PSP [Flavobacterium caeni]